MKMLNIATVLASSIFLTGCLAKTALDVVTLPVRAASSGVDAVTTSQSEADEKRGRELRQREEKLGKLARKRDKAVRKCQRGDRDSCARAEDLNRDIYELQAQPY